MDAAVACSRYPDSLRIHVTKPLEELGPGNGVPQVTTTPVPVVEFFECIGVTGASPDVGQQHNVSALHEILNIWLEIIDELISGPTVDEQQPRVFLISLPASGTIEIRVDDETVKALVSNTISS